MPYVGLAEPGCPGSWASDACCRLAFEYSFLTANPSENFRHTLHLTFERGDAGLLGSGTYTLSGLGNCTVPLEAVGTAR